MKQVFKSISIVILLVFVSFLNIECRDDLSSENLLIGSWTHSPEEQTESGILIYRPTHFKQYPPSWYRNTFFLNGDNTCDYLALAANDGHFFEKGTWDYNEDSKILTISYIRTDPTPHIPKENVVLKFEVMSLEKNMLKLKSIS